MIHTTVAQKACHLMGLAVTEVMMMNMMMMMMMMMMIMMMRMMKTIMMMMMRMRMMMKTIMMMMMRMMMMMMMRMRMMMKTIMTTGNKGLLEASHQGGPRLCDQGPVQGAGITPSFFRGFHPRLHLQFFSSF